MSSSSSVNNLKEEVSFFRNETFYSFVKENCGDIVLEIMQAQDISSVECLFDVGNIFTFLELDSNELAPLKKAGIILNDGSFVVKKGILHKVEIFTRPLRVLNQQHSTSSLSRSNNSSDLIIPGDLVQKFSFLVTLITYSKFIMKSKIDFTFFYLMMTNIINNSIKEDRGYRYDSIVRHICAEDCTATVSKIVYDTQTNTFIGFSLPLDQNGLPIAKSYSTDSFTCLENWYLNDPIAKSLGAHLIQPLSSSLENISPYLLAVDGTNNKFKSPDVITRWGYIYRQCKAKGVRVIGYSTDCDCRYLNAMKRPLGFFGDFAYHNHPDNYEINIPNKWNWFLTQSKQLFIRIQNPMHICTKLRNRLLSKTTTLVFGDQLINIQRLVFKCSVFYYQCSVNFSSNIQ
ncbi:unnamed protein product [Rotaria magnacalcarata]|uniref:Uncharacterized protein n=3 Tax=Rotaria magnacalcarata TaxID=392030 RepID=A0A819EY45_9BILA|nr:unnamed protein product [Rotaria magnacalcarata]CAF3858330.1 unnamed protein product [Rotaria magnacalcarata]